MKKIWKLDAEKRTTEYGSKNDFFGYWRMDKIRFIESFDMAKFQTKCELEFSSSDKEIEEKVKKFWRI